MATQIKENSNVVCVSIPYIDHMSHVFVYLFFAGNARTSGGPRTPWRESKIPIIYTPHSKYHKILEVNLLREIISACNGYTIE